MFEQVVANLLNKLLGDYIDNLETKQLNIGIWAGDVVLKSLRLNSNALNKLDLPVTIMQGYVGDLVLKIPWHNLKGQPFQIFIDNVVMVVSPRQHFDPKAEQQRQHERKMRILQDMEIQQVEDDSSYTSQLVNKIIDNMQIMFGNIHIRYEDKTSFLPFAVGIELQELSVFSVDQNWVKKQDTNEPRKLCNLSNLLIYWSEELIEKTLTFENFFDYMQKSKTKQYILNPVSGTAKLQTNKKYGVVPKYDVMLEFHEFKLTVSKYQYQSFLYVLKAFEQYKAQIMIPKPERTAKSRWKYCLEATKQQVHEKLQPYRLENLIIRKQQRQEYVNLFYLKMNQQLTEINAAKLEEMERFLSVEDLFRYRQLARTQPVKKEKTWSEWMWGSEEINRIIDYDESLVEHEKTMAPDCLFISFHLNLHRMELELLDEQKVNVELEEFECLGIKKVNQNIELQFKVHNILMQMNQIRLLYSEQNNVFDLKLQNKLYKTITLEMQNIHVLLDKKLIMFLNVFFEPPIKTSFNVTKTLRHQTNASLEYALSNYKTWNLTLIINSIFVTVPYQNDEVLFCGSIRVKSEANMSDVLLNQMYNRFRINLEKISIKVNNDNLIQNVDLDLLLEQSIVPLAENLTKTKLSGNLQSLCLNLSTKKYKCLMQALDVIFKLFQNDEVQSQTQNLVEFRFELIDVDVFLDFAKLSLKNIVVLLNQRTFDRFVQVKIDNVVSLFELRKLQVDYKEFQKQSPEFKEFDQICLVECNEVYLSEFNSLLELHDFALKTFTNENESKDVMFVDFKTENAVYQNDLFLNLKLQLWLGLEFQLRAQTVLQIQNFVDATLDFEYDSSLRILGTLNLNYKPDLIQGVQKLFFDTLELYNYYESRRKTVIQSELQYKIILNSLFIYQNQVEATLDQIELKNNEISLQNLTLTTIINEREQVFTGLNIEFKDMITLSDVEIKLSKVQYNLLLKKYFELNNEGESTEKRIILQNLNLELTNVCVFKLKNIFCNINKAMEIGIDKFEIHEQQMCFETKHQLLLKYSNDSLCLTLDSPIFYCSLDLLRNLNLFFESDSPSSMKYDLIISNAELFYSDFKLLFQSFRYWQHGLCLQNFEIYALDSKILTNVDLNVNFQQETILDFGPLCFELGFNELLLLKKLDFVNFAKKPKSKQRVWQEFNYQIKFQGISLCLRDDVDLLDIPIFQIFFRETIIQITQTDDLRISTDLLFLAQMFNIKCSQWEPIIEPCTLNFNLLMNDQFKINATSEKMNINLTHEMLKEIKAIYDNFPQKYEKKQEQKQPLLIRNRTGHDVSIWGKNTHHQLIQVGMDLNWSFIKQDYVAIHVHGLWETIENVLIFKENQTKYLLRPKINNLCHLVVDVKIEKKLKLITLKSTFCLLNETTKQIQINEFLLEPNVEYCVPISKVDDLNFKSTNEYVVHSQITDLGTLVTFSPPIQVENLLPMEIIFQLWKHEKMFFSQSVYSNQTLKIGLKTTTIIFTIKIPELDLFTSKSAIVQPNQEFDKLLLNNNVELKVFMEEKLNSRKIIIYSTYVVLNRLDMELKLGSFSIPPNQKQLYSEDKMSLFVSNSQWKKNISLSELSQETCLSLIHNSEKKQMFVTLLMETVFLSKVLSVCPRFVIQNLLTDIIQFKQLNQNDVVRIRPKKSASVEWLDKPDQILTFSIISSGVGWSTPLNIMELGTCYLELKPLLPIVEPIVLQTKAVMEKGVTHVFIQKSNYPFRFENMTQTDVYFCQTGYPKRLIKSGSNVFYCWDNSLDEKSISLYFNEDDGRTINLFEIGNLQPMSYKHQNKTVTANLTLYVDGDVRVLHLSNPQHKRKQSVDKTMDKTAIQLNLNIGVSLCQNEELLFVTLKNLVFLYRETSLYDLFSLKIHYLQVDNMKIPCLDPIVLYALHPDTSTFHLSLTKVKDDKINYFKGFDFLLQELAIQMDEELISNLQSFFDFSVKTEETWLEKLKLTTVNPQLDLDLCYFEYFKIQPIKLNLSFTASNSKHSVSSIFSNLVANIHDFQLRLNSLCLLHPFGSTRVLLDVIMKHYWNQINGNLYRALFSTDMIGNPAGLFHNVASGIQEVFYEPLQGFISDRPQDIAYGLGKGVTSLLGKTVFGAVDSVSRISSAWGKGIASASMDSKFQKSRITRNRPRNAVAGVTSGAKSLAKGVVSAVTGIVTQPLEGAEKQGISGLFKGLGKGVLGLGVKPIVGVLDMVSNITQGVKNTATMFQDEEIDRVRLPRCLQNNLLVEYDELQALGQFWLRACDNFLFLDQQYVSHCCLDKHAVILSTKGIFFIKTESLNMEWVIWFMEISKISTKEGLELHIFKKKHYKRVLCPKEFATLCEFYYKRFTLQNKPLE